MIRSCTSGSAAHHWDAFRWGSDHIVHIDEFTEAIVGFIRKLVDDLIPKSTVNMEEYKVHCKVKEAKGLYGEKTRSWFEQSELRGTGEMEMSDLTLL